MAMVKEFAERNLAECWQKKARGLAFLTFSSTDLDAPFYQNPKHFPIPLAGRTEPSTTHSGTSTLQPLKNITLVVVVGMQTVRSTILKRKLGSCQSSLATRPSKNRKGGSDTSAGVEMYTAPGMKAHFQLAFD